MKTAVSIPDATFERAERLAKRTRRSRSKLFADALEEYLDRHAVGDEVTERMNAALEGIDQEPDGFAFVAANLTFARNEW